MEYYKTGVAETTMTKIYLDTGDGLKHLCNAEGYHKDTALNSETIPAAMRIKYGNVADAGYTAYLDDVSFTQIDKDYEAITN